VTAKVAAAPEQAFEAVMTVSASEMPLASGLFLMRMLPASRRQRAAAAAGRKRPLIDALMGTPGFLHLEGPEGNWGAFGYVGKPWTLRGGARRLTREEYEAFDEPGYAKVATDFVATADGAGSLLSTTTRIHLTDEQARRAFRRYWLAVKWGSWAVRKDWLRAARRRAQQGLPSTDEFGTPWRT